MSDYKKYDSHAQLTVHNARLAKDAEAKDGEKGKMVRLTFVLTSRADADSDLWVEATVNDRQADFAEYLRKGDTVGVQGFPVLRRWGDNNEKFAFNLRRAEIFPSIELFSAVKERGFTPGAAKSSKPVSKTKTAPKAPTKRPQVKLDDDDDLPADE